MSRSFRLLALVPFIGLGFVTSNTQAAPTVTFNADQSAFRPLGSSGIPTDGFMVTTSDLTGDSIGLRARERGGQTLSQTNNGTEATYYASPGTSSSNSNYATWNFDYIVTPGSGREWDDFDEVRLTITGLDGTTISQGFGSGWFYPGLDPMTLGGLINQDNTNPDNDQIANDSLNLGFGTFNTSSSQFDPYATGVYKFTLSLTDKSGGTISQTMNVQVGQLNAVPEPSTLALAGIGALVGMGYARRRRRNPTA